MEVDGLPQIPGKQVDLSSGSRLSGNHHGLV